MIESENLRTASLYINNQLLSRGLLRDGQSINFAHPGDSDGDVAETMSHIMAVVNDLILRRDRDAEHRESLSATLRTLRAESLRQANDIQRLQEKHAEAQRKVGLSEAAETALRSHLKTADATVHRLKEEAARTKSLVAQTRAACANEVRKRDRQIEGLKKAVTEAGRARGAGKSPGITTITVIGDIGSNADHDLSNGGAGNEGYDLRMETNAFLAELAKGLSGENETLLQLIRRTMEQLKEMSGWDAANGVAVENGDGHALALAANPADMAAEVDAVLEHLRTILTNPSFVPIEEVVVRENEIHRLRDGWEKMETRWKEAVHLIDGWRKRMQASGRPVNVEELKMGLRLSPVKVNHVEETTHGFGIRLEAVPEDGEDVDMVRQLCEEGPLDLAPEPGAHDGEDSDASSVFEHDLNVEDLDMDEPNVEILQQSVMLSSPPLPQPPQLSPLRDSYAAGNRGERSSRRRHPGEFHAIAEENTREAQLEEAPLPPSPSKRAPPSPQKRPILSLRPVPPEEAAAVALPPSAIVTTPDTSVDSIPLVRLVDKPASKSSSTSASTRSQKRPPPATKKPKREEAKPPKSPAKSRPTRQNPATSANSGRGRSQTRKEEQTQRSKPSTRATSATSASSSKSTVANSKSAKSKPPPPTPATTRAAAAAAAAAQPPPAQTPGCSPKRVNSRLPLPRNGCTNVLPPPQQSPLTMETIAAKLAASEREADAARVRAKLKAARLNKGVNLPPPGTTTNSSTSSRTAATGDAESSETSSRSTCVRSTRSAAESEGTAATMTSNSVSMQSARDEEDGADELGLEPPFQLQSQQSQQSQQSHQREQNIGTTDPEKRKTKPATRKRERRTSKVTSRRRSTLSPWELDALIQGGTVTVER